MAQITRITSEALQATVRRLLPSQQGFGEDLEATNVITPIIDLTPTAEGSVLPSYLQQALAHGSQTSFNIKAAATTSLVSTPGFYRIIGMVSTQISNSVFREASFQITDGSTVKTLIQYTNYGGTQDSIVVMPFDFISFLRAGDTLQALTDNGNSMSGSTRQVADVDGNLVNPAGFTIT